MQIKKYISFALAALLLTACNSDFLNKAPEDTINTSNFFQDGRRRYCCRQRGIPTPAMAQVVQHAHVDNGYYGRQQYCRR